VRTAGEAPLSFVRRPPRTKECEHDHPDRLRYTKIPLNHGSGAMAAVGFGTLIPDLLSTKQATKTALEVGFRHFDCAERYRNDPAAKSVRGWEIMPRTPIRHGFPLKPLVVRLAARTERTFQSRTHRAIGKTTHT
jgi:hypothetical protein